MLDSTTSRPTLSLKPVTHTHFTNLAEWEAEAVARGFVCAEQPVSYVSPFPLKTATSPGGRLVGACFISGIAFGWLRDL